MLYEVITVSGTLKAEGTPDAPIYFTSIKDDSVGRDINGNTTSPAAGNWSGLQFDARITSYNVCYTKLLRGKHPPPPLRFQRAARIFKKCHQVLRGQGRQRAIQKFAVPGRLCKKFFPVAVVGHIAASLASYNFV